MSSSALSTFRLVSRAGGHLLQPCTRPSVLRTARPTIYARLPVMSSHSFHMTAFQAAEAGDPMQGIDPNHPFIQQLRKNPHILEQLAEFTVLLQEKGLDVASGKQPGFGQIMKLMSDPEIKATAAKLAQDMQAAGIQMDMNSVMELQKAFGGPRSGSEDENSTENKGLLGRAKGFFKK